MADGSTLRDRYESLAYARQEFSPEIYAVRLHAFVGALVEVVEEQAAEIERLKAETATKRDLSNFAATYLPDRV